MVDGASSMVECNRGSVVRTAEAMGAGTNALVDDANIVRAVTARLYRRPIIIFALCLLLVVKKKLSL